MANILRILTQCQFNQKATNYMMLIILIYKESTHKQTLFQKNSPLLKKNKTIISIKLNNSTKPIIKLDKILWELKEKVRLISNSLTKHILKQKTKHLMSLKLVNTINFKLKQDGYSIVLRQITNFSFNKRTVFLVTIKLWW